MNKERKNRLFHLILCLALALALLTGCSAHSSMSYTFTVTVADGVTQNVEVELNTAKGHLLTQSGNAFAVEDANGNSLSSGFFLTQDMYDAYCEAASQNADYTQTTVNGEPGVMYSINGGEWDYLFHVANCDVYIALGNGVSQQSADEVLSLLTFTAE